MCSSSSRARREVRALGDERGTMTMLSVHQHTDGKKRLEGERMKSYDKGGERGAAGGGSRRERQGLGLGSPTPLLFIIQTDR